MDLIDCTTQWSQINSCDAASPSSTTTNHITQLNYHRIVRHFYRPIEVEIVVTSLCLAQRLCLRHRIFSKQIVVVLTERDFQWETTHSKKRNSKKRKCFLLNQRVVLVRRRTVVVVPSSPDQPCDEGRIHRRGSCLRYARVVKLSDLHPRWLRRAQ